MTNQIKCAVLFAGTLLLSLAGATSQNVLTDVTVFGCDSSGSYVGVDVWVTRPSSYIAAVFIESGACGSQFLNGPDNAHVQPSISFSIGTNSFKLFGDPGANNSYFGINLFFNGSTTPSISAFCPMLTTSGPHTFTANSSPNTSGPPGVGTVPGAATLTSTSAGQTITLKDFYWAAPNVYNLDEVGLFTTGADERFDYVGGISFSVTGDR